MTFKNKTKVLVDSKSKVKAISQALVLPLGPKIQKTNVRAQKSNVIILETNKMIISTFFILDKDSKGRFFEKNFLLTDVKLDIVFGILFLIMNNIDIYFQAQELQWKFTSLKTYFQTIEDLM